MLFGGLNIKQKKKKGRKIGCYEIFSLPISQFMEEPAEIHLSNINYRDFHE